MHARVHGRLSARMLELAEPTLADYRTDMPAAKLLDWRQAAAALAIAVRLRPDSEQIAARLRYVDGHITRINAPRTGDAARVAQTRALRLFREAARLDPDWPDPYLGMARIHAYGIPDFDALAKDIDDARARGYQPGRRERSQLGDGFRARADLKRTAALRAPADERPRLLREAVSDYQGCIAEYDGLTGYYNSDGVFSHCTRQLADMNELLEDELF
jgi:hypothetical protein